jgi:type I restriction enzyme M protein
MTIVLPHGVLFRGGEEGEIRKNLIENNKIDAIIGLPANIFFGTGIPTIIMVLKQKRHNTDVLIVDASKGFAKVGKNNMLRACDIKKIVDVVTKRTSVEKFAKVVTRDEIRANEYNLNIPRYVDSSEKPESWDIYSSMFGGIPESELRELHEYWAAFPTLKEALFSPDNEAYCHLNVPDLKEAVGRHLDVASFKSNYLQAFEGFETFLNNELINGMLSLNISHEESVLSEDIFARLANIPLVDKYEAYQLLDEDWGHLAIDLEIIQTEGFKAAKQVDPNIVIKKKDGKDQEVQEGWIGHVIPFDLVQNSLLLDELTSLSEKEARLTEITGEFDSLLDVLSEEDKEKDYVNDAKDAFVAAEVKKALKAKDAEAETLAVLKKVDALITEEKAFKTQVKEDAAKLHIKTKETIESLSDDAVLELLKLKWITPLVESIGSLPQTVLNEFAGKMEPLCRKYETTFAEVEQQIAETEQSLIGLLDELCGNEFDMKGLVEFKTLLGGE